MKMIMKMKRFKQHPQALKHSKWKYSCKYARLSKQTLTDDPNAVKMLLIFVVQANHVVPTTDTRV